MNSTKSKMLYTYSIESLFLRYKKAVKIGGFLQCLVYKFLEHDGCFRKINLRIFSNYTMKNFRVKHGQYGNISFPKTFFFFESSRQL